MSEYLFLNMQSILLCVLDHFDSLIPLLLVLDLGPLDIILLETDPPLKLFFLLSVSARGHLAGLVKFLDVSPFFVLTVI